ncbi:hypothetical protein ACFCYH_21870 [Streptomyces sp. NPDC056400]|uniref:hypothetical protein n=1 Tax=Streptomyces sp. NPDC056400 TaxID=3345808 RepID=UPI0035D5EDC6
MDMDYLFKPVRYRSLGGAIVIADGLSGRCTGCSATTYNGNHRTWAQKHADKCRALPRR